MSKEDFIEVFIESAVNAARETNSEHPDDIAFSMASAIESTALTLAWIHFQGRQ